MLFAMLALSGLVMVGCASAQFVQTPSVPEFTVELVDSSYDEPTTYFTDPYTGETVTHEGYHVYRQNIELKIKNQPFTPYTETGGQNIDFYYNIRIKGHFTGDWIELYNPSDGFPPQSSGSEYTEFSYIWGGDANTMMGSKSISLPAGAQVDFQVEAMVGYTSRSGEPPWFPWTFYGETSGWSSTQTLTIVEFPTPSPEPTPSSEPTPTDSNTSPTSSPNQEPVLTQEQLVIFGLAVTVAVLAVGLGLLLYGIKRK
jgi:hypothetical protein